MMRLVSFLITTCLAFVALSGYGQGDQLSLTSRAYQKGKLTQALGYSDKTIADAKLAKDPKTWVFRGYILKDLYKKHKSEDPNNRYREDAIKAFKECIKLDGDKLYEKDCIYSLNYLGVILKPSSKKNNNQPKSPSDKDHADQRN